MKNVYVSIVALLLFVFGYLYFVEIWTLPDLNDTWGLVSTALTAFVVVFFTLYVVPRTNKYIEKHPEQMKLTSVSSYRVLVGVLAILIAILIPFFIWGFLTIG